MDVGSNTGASKAHHHNGSAFKEVNLQSSSWLEQTLSQSKTHGLSYIDVEPFLQDDFDPQEYANSIIEAPNASQINRRKGNASAKTDSSDSSTTSRELAANWLPQSGRVEGDLSVALGRLNVAIDDVDRLVREEVTQNASTLLKHTTTLLDLRPTLNILTASLDTLDNHQAKLVAKISAPQQVLEEQTVRLAKMRTAQSTVKQSQRLVRLLRRLQSQMQELGISKDERKGGEAKGQLDRLGEEDGEDISNQQSTAIDDVIDADLDESAGRGLSRAAMTVAEILSMLYGSTSQDGKDHAIQAEENGEEKEDSKQSLLELDFVQECLPMIEEARERVTDMMEDMIVRGLRDLAPTLLSTSLQTAYNLGHLTDLVRDLLADLTDVVRDRVHAAFDMQSLAREIGSKEPQSQQSTSYRARRGGDYSTALHQRWTNAIWTRLETLIIGEMGAVCSKVYTLERVLSLKNDTSAGVNYLEKAMKVLGDKPSAMFWSTLGNAIEEEINQSQSQFMIQTLEQSYPRLLRIFQEFYAKVSVYTGTSYTHSHQSPETLVILRSLARFEDTFLSRCSSRFDTLLNTSFTVKQLPGPKEAATLAKLALNELDNARLDPLLLHAIGKIVCDWLARGARRIEDLVVQDASVQSLQSLHPSHSRNASLTGAAYQLQLGLQRIADQGPTEYKERVTDLQKQVRLMSENRLIEPILQTVLKEISDVMARMQYVDFSLSRDAVSGSGSAYMADLSDRMWFLREQLFVQYDVPTSEWLVKIAKHALYAFVANASLIRPLEEGGKLKLTSDMTELEFSISQLLASAHQVTKPLSMNDCGTEFHALRSFRHLLFTDVTKWDPVEELRAGLPPLAAAHHIIARSRSIALPNELHKWSRIEYLRWLQSHSQQEGMQLIKGSLEEWKAKRKEENNEEDEVFMKCVERILSFVGEQSKKTLEL
ncbi:uncharacterized protein FA14DRAFT_161516 [Meira miltonrushii]|uniref:Conserved oligomeric Golgi complex subunit 5 n=1 Tax=Meira miltonrushii TaxID=1280837 RepID=A0A316V8U7_9BASI|nr:uncharacterized protein FA14DRAFT_161516 [Meira miltonrushii]PWN33882.1 hypothetical protein FA14DRAFT_161516 [Meira miltonrushii]